MEKAFDCYQRAAIATGEVTNLEFSRFGDYIATISEGAVELHHTGSVLAGNEACVWRTIDGIQSFCFVSVNGRTHIAVATKECLIALTTQLDQVGTARRFAEIVLMAPDRLREGWVITLNRAGKLSRYDMAVGASCPLPVPSAIVMFCQAESGAIFAVADNNDIFLQDTGKSNNFKKLPVQVSMKIHASVSVSSSVVLCGVDSGNKPVAAVVSLDDGTSKDCAIQGFSPVEQKMFVAYDPGNARVFFASDASSKVVCGKIGQKGSLEFLGEIEVDGYVLGLRASRGSVVVASEHELRVFIAKESCVKTEQYNSDSVFMFTPGDDAIVPHVSSFASMPDLAEKIAKLPKPSALEKDILDAQKFGLALVEKKNAISRIQKLEEQCEALLKKLENARPASASRSEQRRYQRTHGLFSFKPDELRFAGNKK